MASTRNAGVLREDSDDVNRRTEISGSTGVDHKACWLDEQERALTRQTKKKVTTAVYQNLNSVAYQQVTESRKSL